MPQDHDESCIFWFALLQQDHDMTNHILTCCGSWTSKPQTLHLLLKLATKSIRNPAAIRDTRKWNPIVVEQEVVIWQLLSDRICYVCGLQHHYFYTLIMSNHLMSYNIYYDLQSYHFAWLSEWVPDCTDPIPSCSNTLGMQFLVSWIALGLQWDFGFQKACGNICRC